MFRKLKSVVVFLKVIVEFVLSRPFGKVPEFDLPIIHFPSFSSVAHSPVF